MRFETKAAGSNGQAAWALVYGLMQVLRSKNLLSADELRLGIIEAGEHSALTAQCDGSGSEGDARRFAGRNQEEGSRPLTMCFDVVRRCAHRCRGLSVLRVAVSGLLMGYFQAGSPARKYAAH